MNPKQQLSSSSSSNCSSFSTITNQTEKKAHRTPPLNSMKFTVKLDNSNPSVLPTVKKCNDSRKRKEPEKEINLGLSLYDQTWFNIKDNTQNKKTEILDDPPAYMGPKKSPEDIRVAKRLRSFRVYCHQEEEEEKFMGVSTKLKLFDDPWKIRKVLRESDCNHLCRLMLSKDLVKKNIIDVWNHVGYVEEVAKIWSKDGVGVKVLDYDRDTEYELTFKNLLASDCYVFGHNWSPKFVKERSLKRGDEIGLYWSHMHSRFVLSVLARAPAPAP